MSGTTFPCSCGCGTTGICPCDQFVHPQSISNPPGRDSISYRVGDYVAFREALLRSRPGEVELANWRPGAEGDLAVQMVEWWAYLSDILTFYNEHIANEDYLRTAVLPESVQGLIRLLGYRPRPGIGARGILAALMSGNKSLTLPQGFQIQSKPGPGKQPQIFELDAQTAVRQPDSIAADPPPNPVLLGPDGNSVLLSGVISPIKFAAELLIVGKNWNGDDSNYAVVTVASSAQEKDPRGRANTRVKFQSSAAITVKNPGSLAAGGTATLQATLPATTSAAMQAITAGTASLQMASSQPQQFIVETPVRQAIMAGLANARRGGMPAPPAGLKGLSQANAADYRLQKSSQSAHVWQYINDLNQILFDVGGGNASVHLDALTRQIHIGDVILFDGVGGAQPRVLASVTGYSEAIYYANPDGTPPNAATPPANPPNIPIPILHSVITFRPEIAISHWTVNPATLLVRYSWQDVDTLIGTPSTTLAGTQLSLRTPIPASALPLTDADILIGDAKGNGVEAAATAGAADPLTVGLSSPKGPSDSTWLQALQAKHLQAPLNVLFDLLQVSRGKTVSNEVLGSGNATIITGQEFALQKSPLTYLEDPNSVSGDGYTSTLQVWVNGIQWQEVPSFYGQEPDGRVFVTREDENNVTHVQFGDGVNGARLPSGTNNVVATYRYGSGAESPDAGSLTVILKPWPGLKSIVNPVPAGGGGDPDPPHQIKKYAPQSVLTFGRAVSADDYEVIASQSPGVSRARAYWTWDDAQHRMVVKVYVGDDDNAVSSASTALAGAGDPNRPIRVQLAQSVPLSLTLTLIVDPAYVSADVVTAATAALVDPDAGLLGHNVIQIGQSIFESQIYRACLAVAGVQAVHDLAIIGAGGATCSCCTDGDYRYDPGEGGFFSVSTPSNQIISPEVGNAS
jgi:hypothetical protein